MRGGRSTASALLRWSPQWCVEPGEATELVLSAGPDHRAAIDGLAAAHLALVAGWAAGVPVEVPPGIEPLIDLLVEVGALVPEVEVAPATALLGDPLITASLAAGLAHGRVVALPEAAVVLVVRTGAAWPEPDEPLAPDQLQLGVDLALHHTVVIGPLVVPGASSCLACLDARVSGFWGTPAVPGRPGVQRWLPAVASLIDVQLEQIGRGASPLVNATVSWNLERGATASERLYRVDGCPRCQPAAVAPRVALRWAP